MKLKHSVWGEKGIPLEYEDMGHGTQGPRRGLGQREKVGVGGRQHAPGCLASGSTGGFGCPGRILSTHLVTLPFLDTLGLLLSWCLP